ncbi:MAG: hypothetical protein KH452_06280 [Clostridiales bacterium]|nr:hypothetical protein [Clostridiales bacterium]
MYHGKYEDKQLHCRRKNRRKAGTLFLSLLLMIVLAVGGTVAYLTTQSSPVQNNFTPSFVDCEVEEEFDGAIKSNVNVTNTGDTEAYIRVKLITYRVNDEGQHIGGTAEIPKFTPGDNWIKYESKGEVYYYYTLPVAPGNKPASDLISSIALTGTYNDADGGKQVIEVMAEAIQSGPAEAVGASWGVSISEGSVTAYTN